MYRVLSSVLVILGYTNYMPVNSQYVQSPCPETFEYKNDGGGVHGLIHLQPNGPASMIHVMVNFTIAARIVANYPGRLETINPTNLQLNSPIDYRVDFPVSTPLPRLTYLTVNGNVLCHGPGDIVQPNLYVTTISLQHTLYLRGGRPGTNQGFNQDFNQGPNQGFNQFTSRPKPQDPGSNQVFNQGSNQGFNQFTSGPKPQDPGSNQVFNQGPNQGFNQFTSGPKPQDPGSNQEFNQGPNQDTSTFNVSIPLSSDTQVFTFDVDNDRTGTWTNVLQRPQQQPQTQRPPPPPPPPTVEYHPEYNTTTRRPSAPPPPPPPVEYHPEYNTTTRRPAPPPPPPPPPPPIEYHPEYNTTTIRPAPPPPLPPPPPPIEYHFEYNTTTIRPAPPPLGLQQTYPSVPSRNPTFSSSECGVVSGGNEHVPLVYHGMSFPRGDWPWLVAIYKRKDGSLTFACSGTLVSDRHVVSAAHCIQQRSTLTSIRDIVVKVGVYNLEDWGDDITVTRTLESATIHESFNSTTYENDLLVLTFERSVEFNINIRPACLWDGNNDLNRIVGASGVVAGWGASELGPGSKGEPRMVRVPVVTTSMCRASRPEFHVFTSDNTLCAGDRNGAGPCLGDSGGGLYLLDGGRWRLRGVVSLSLRPENGESTCNLNEYIIFTDTAKLLKWIKNAIKN